MEAVLVRGAAGTDGLQIIASTAAGVERELALIPASSFEWWWLNHPIAMAVSTSGHLALRTGGKADFYTLVFDLADPEARARTYPYNSLAFDPKGRMWIPDPEGSAYDRDVPVRAFEIVDPATDERTRLDVPANVASEDLGPAGFGPFGLDGEAILASTRYRLEPPWPDGWLIGTDGQLLRSAELAWPGPRWISPVHYELIVCGRDEDRLQHPCPQGRGTVIAGPRRGDGTWYRSADPAAVDASWDAGLDGLWLLLESAARGSSTGDQSLLHLDAPSNGPAAPVDQAPIRLGLSAAEAIGSTILGLSADDSIIVIGRRVSDELVGSVAIVDVPTGEVSLHEGRFAGFVPAGFDPAAD
jgi:hypothetical protein